MMDPVVTRRRLEGERAVVQRLRRQADTERAAQDREPSTMSAEAGSELLEREVRDSLVLMLDADLTELDAALHRLDEGIYGRCETCGATIPDERLAALPATRRCVAHAGS
jgi:RNA polymerase-binding transcription factor DksA